MKQAQDFAENDPDVSRVLVDADLQKQNRAKVLGDITDEPFVKKLRKRSFIKSIKQKLAFIAGSALMFKTLEEISVAPALTPAVQISLGI